MINLEARLDREFKTMNAKVYVYHIRDGVKMFGGLTITTEIKQDMAALSQMIWELSHKCEIGALFTNPPNRIDAPATWMRKELAKRGYHGVALCAYRDQFSRKRGRIIAKGRLLKAIRQREEQDYQQEMYAQIEYENRDIKED